MGVYPVDTGNAAVMEVLDIGEAAANLMVGDLIFGTDAS
jgi:hypothetical protein